MNPVLGQLVISQLPKCCATVTQERSHVA